MVKVEVIQDGWGGFKKGHTFEAQKTTADALVAHKVVKLLTEKKADK